MIRKIIFTRPDGGLTVVHPCRNTIPRVETLTDEEIEQRAWAKLPADAINPQFVDASVIPADRTFRNAWTHGGDAIDIDMVKALDIHKNTLRELRAPLLADLDQQFMRALETGDTKAQATIAADKQALRDVTKDEALAAAATPEALKAVMPGVLLAD